MYTYIYVYIYIYTYIVNANDMNYYRRLGGLHFRSEDGTQHRLGDEANTKTQALLRMGISTVKLASPKEEGHTTWESKLYTMSCASAVKNGTPRYKKKDS